MLPFHARSRTDDITDALTWLIGLRGGIPAITTRAVAGRVGLSVGTLAHHLTNRERMLQVCGQTFAARRLLRVQMRLDRGGIGEALPASEDDLVHERVWMAWRELARDDVHLARTVAEADCRERTDLALTAWPLPVEGNRHLPAALTDDVDIAPEAQDALLAVVVGLREALCAHPDEAWPLSRARAALAHAIRALGASHDRGCHEREDHS